MTDDAAASVNPSSDHDLAMPTAPFGSTGHHSSRVLFGAAALGSMSQARADATLALLAPSGINHIDTAASYGESEDRLKTFLADHRDEFFLATKTGERAGDKARAELERSLARMGVDSVDLIQLHNLVEPEEWEQVFSPGGALEAVVQARDEGLCRFIGVTGHGTRIAAMHRRSLEEFDFDSVLLPFNHSMLSQPGYRDDAVDLIERCVEGGVAVQTIKSIARRRWADESERQFSWYEPLTDGDAITNAVHYVLGQRFGGAQPLFVNSSSDARLLPTIVAAARSFNAGSGSPDEATMEADQLAHGITPLFDGDRLERI